MALFSTTIKVPVSTLQEYAAKLQGFADDNRGIFNRVYNSLQCLRGSGEWIGASLEAAVEATEKNKDKFEDTMEELAALAEYMKNFANAMAEKDEEIKKSIQAVG